MKQSTLIEVLKTMAEVFRACFPLACILCAVGLAIFRSDTERVQLALLSIGGTAYQYRNNENKEIPDHVHEVESASEKLGIGFNMPDHHSD